MRYSRLGDTGLIISRLAMGTMTFGEAEGPMAALYKVDQSGASHLIGQALDAGVNYFDTADVYADGRSEEMLSQALGGNLNNVVIATKVGNRVGKGITDQGLSKRHILAAADASLRRLGRDWIDVYFAHRVDPYTPLEETLQALQQLVTSGKVRYLGFSNWPAWLAAKAIGIQRANGWEPFRAAQMYYSLLGRDLEHEVIPFAKDAGVGVQVWSPLAGGFLSGRYTAEDPSGGGGRLAKSAFIPFDRDLGGRVVARLAEMGASLGATPAQLALLWLLHRNQVDTVLVGASGSDQLAANLQALDITLPPEFIDELEALTRPAEIYPGWYSHRSADRLVQNALDTTEIS